MIDPANISPEEQKQTIDSNDGFAAKSSVSSKKQFTRIEEIIDQENARRKRTLGVLIGLVGITVLLALLVLAFGRKDEELTRNIIENQVKEQTPSIVRNEVNTSIPSIVENKLDPIVNDVVKNKLDPIVTDVVKNTLEPSVQQEVSKQMEPQIASLKNELSVFPETSIVQERQLLSLNSIIPQFNSVELKEIKNTISAFPQQKENLQQVSGQLQELMAISNAARGDIVCLSDPERDPEICRRIAKLEQSIEKNQLEVVNLTNKIEMILSKLNGDKEPCGKLSQTGAGNYLTYSVKENSKSDIYDLGVQVSVKRQKNKSINGVIVNKNGRNIFGPKDIEMGELINFEDDKYKYSLIPVYINRRFLTNDFIGLAISRVEKCKPKE